MRSENETLCIVFPGQGVQRNGMGRDFYDRFATTREVFEEACDATGLDIPALCFCADPRLQQTQYAQPAILTVEIAILRTLQAEYNIQADLFGGHSLGEYAGLVASGACGFFDAVQVVSERGRLMQQAVEVGGGGMLAVIGDALETDNIRHLAVSHKVEIANDNSSKQIVLSGLNTDIQRAEKTIGQAFPSVRLVRLDVSAPFHSSYMRVIEHDFRHTLEDKLTKSLQASNASRVTSNVNGGYHEADPASVLDLLLRQVWSPVCWRSNMETLAKQCNQFFEIGPGSVLRGLFKTLGIQVKSINSIRAAGKLAA